MVPAVAVPAAVDIPGIWRDVPGHWDTCSLN